MNASRVKLLLWSAAAVMSLGAAAAVVAAFVLPLDVPAPAARATAGPAKASSAPQAVASLDAYKAVWDLKLRRPLVDAAPVVPVVTPAQVATNRIIARPAVRLAGTVVDGSRPRGLFVTGNGKVELRAAGEKVAGADVVQVDDKGATLSSAGQTFRLAIERVAPPPPPATRPAVAAPANASIPALTLPPRPAAGGT